MGKSRAPGPDPQMGRASLEQIALAREQFADYQQNERPWMRALADEALGIHRSNAQRADALADHQLETMRFHDNRYRTVGLPFEDALIRDVDRFDSETYKDSLVARSLADTTAAFDRSNADAVRGLQRRGVNPNSGAFAAMTNQNAIARASAKASAANKTRQAADQIGLSTRMQMFGGMRGIAGLGATNASLGMGAMGVGQNAASSMMGTGGGVLQANNAAQGVMHSGFSSGIQGLGQFNQFQNQATQINNANSPFGALLGAGSQLGAAWLGRR